MQTVFKNKQISFFTRNPVQGDTYSEQAVVMVSTIKSWTAPRGAHSPNSRLHLQENVLKLTDTVAEKCETEP